MTNSEIRAYSKVMDDLNTMAEEVVAVNDGWSMSHRLMHRMLCELYFHVKRQRDGS